MQIISDAKIWNQIQPKNRRIPLDKVCQAWVILENLQAEVHSSDRAAQQAASDQAAARIQAALQFKMFTNQNPPLAIMSEIIAS